MEEEKKVTLYEYLASPDLFSESSRQKWIKGSLTCMIYNKPDKIIKVMPFEYDVSFMFSDEIGHGNLALQLGMRLKHPNVLRVYDYVLGDSFDAQKNPSLKGLCMVERAQPGLVRAVGMWPTMFISKHMLTSKFRNNLRLVDNF